jgi:hypothetical protein
MDIDRSLFSAPVLDVEEAFPAADGNSQGSLLYGLLAPSRAT